MASTAPAQNENLAAAFNGVRAPLNTAATPSELRGLYAGDSNKALDFSMLYNEKGMCLTLVNSPHLATTGDFFVVKMLA